MKKNNFLDFLIVVLVYIALSCIPFSLVIKDEKFSWLVLLLQILIQAGLFVFIFIFTRFKTKLDYKFGPINIVNALLLIPTLVVCFSNLTNLLIAKESIQMVVNIDLFLRILLAICIVVNEEIIFRLILINNLEIKNKFLVILISAGIFGACHITHFLTTFNPADLLVIVYTFLLGLLLGFAYLFTKCIYPCIVIHFLFNLFQDIFFPYLVLNWIYILVTIVFVAFVAIYLIILIVVKRNNLKVED